MDSSNNDFTHGSITVKLIGLAEPAATVFGTILNLIYYMVYTKKTDAKELRAANGNS